MALLAHLYSHIKGSQEDVATLSLQYIVQENALNRAFTKQLMNTIKEESDLELNYVCQYVGEKRERPDMAGIDPYGKETILCEAKFYTGLTENQPNTYLERLKNENGLGLVFICPDVRRNTLWDKLLVLCNGKELINIDEKIHNKILANQI